MRLSDHRALECQPQELVGDGKATAQGTKVVGTAYSLSMAKGNSGITAAAGSTLRREHSHTQFDS